MSDGNKRAFTLIELLIVLSLIAILAALLFPVLSAARLKAYQTQCLSNMRQTALGVQLYTEDYDETYPMTMEIIGEGRERAPTNVNFWAVSNYQQIVEPYIRTGRGQLNHRSVWYDPADPDIKEPVMWGSFLVNGFLADMPRRISEIPNPSSTIYSVLRRENWSKLQQVERLASNPPYSNNNDAFWQSDYFNMSVMLWTLPGTGGDNQADPYNWRNGKARPPCFSKDTPVPTNDPNPSCKEWDRFVTASRYGGRLTLVYADGHAGTRQPEQTYRSSEDNEWDLH